MNRLCEIQGCGKLHYGKNFCSMHYNRVVRHGDPFKGVAITDRGSAQEYYNSVALRYDGEDCLIWPYSCNSAGYGLMTVGRKRQCVHRLVCAEVYGAPPTPKHQAAHSCGKGHLGCVNKRHLSWKTHKENMADKIIHGTHNRGERHWMSKLTDEKVRDIRLLLTQGGSPADIANQFGVSQGAVWSVLYRRTWAHVNAGEAA